MCNIACTSQPNSSSSSDSSAEPLKKTVYCAWHDDDITYGMTYEEITKIVWPADQVRRQDGRVTLASWRHGSGMIHLHFDSYGRLESVSEPY